MAFIFPLKLYNIQNYRFRVASRPHLQLDPWHCLHPDLGYVVGETTE